MLLLISLLGLDAIWLALQPFQDGLIGHTVRFMKDITSVTSCSCKSVVASEITSTFSGTSLRLPLWQWCLIGSGLWWRLELHSLPVASKAMPTPSGSYANTAATSTCIAIGSAHCLILSHIFSHFMSAMLSQVGGWGRRGGAFSLQANCKGKVSVRALFFRWNQWPFWWCGFDCRSIGSWVEEGARGACSFLFRDVGEDPLRQEWLGWAF